VANWQRELNLLPEWRECKDNKINSNQMAAIIADRLAELLPFNRRGIDDVRQILIRRFRRLSKQRNLRVETFDEAMEQLYDWADTPLDDHWNGKKVCWIKTFYSTGGKAVIENDYPRAYGCLFAAVNMFLNGLIDQATLAQWFECSKALRDGKVSSVDEYMAEHPAPGRDLTSSATPR
jgi:hypothetical protein